MPFPTARDRAIITKTFDLRHHASDQLVEILREKRNPWAWRVAALRWLVYRAPLSVTQGHVYVKRRRLVRIHYGV